MTPHIITSYRLTAVATVYTPSKLQLIIISGGRAAGGGWICSCYIWLYAERNMYILAIISVYYSSRIRVLLIRMFLVDHMRAMRPSFQDEWSSTNSSLRL